jgi:hypothetical protein
MPETTPEKEIEKEIEELLKAAEDYLWRAKANKSKDSQNFEVALALEYATKARDRSKQLMHVKEFYDNTNRRADVVLDELSRLQTTFTRRKSYDEMKYEEGDVGGG